MKRTKISFLLVLLMSLTSIQVKAGYDVALQNNDGKTIYYWWDDALNRKEVWVCDPPSTGGYSGNIVIPASITYENITYPVTRIYAYAFQDCTSLNSVTIPNSVTSIGYMAFKGCSSLNSVSIGNSVTSIETAAFENCTSLTSVTIPTSVTSIGYYAFNGTGWYNNQSNGILYLDNWLIGCKGMGAIPTEIEIVEGTKGIAGRAFWYCTDLTSVTIPNSVKRIGEEAFEYCSSLNNITIPNSVTSIGYYAFNGTGWYNNQSNGILYLDNWLIGYKGENPTGILEIMEGTKGIADAALLDCTSLTSAIIPNSVKTIGWKAFESCSGLTSVSIGNSVTSIGDQAFKCNKLTSVTVKRKTPISISNNVFSNRANATLYVPTIEAYQAADIWSEFKTITEMSESYTMNSLGIGTYCSEYDLDFTNVSGIKAYIACGFNPTTGIVFIMHVNEVPANTGILIKGTPGTYSIPLKESSMYYANMFKGTLTAITVPATEDGNKNYVLASDKLFHGSLGGSTLTANRAYLQIPLSAVGGNSNAPEFIVLEEDNVTGIVAPENTKHMDEGETYNLNGQRVVSPKKGLYIRNGKKVIIN